MAKVPLNEYSFPADRIANVQGQLEKLIAKNYLLHQAARDGFRAYLQAYASYSLKKIFDVNALDLVKVGKGFGFPVPPKVNISVGTSLKTTKKRKPGQTTSDEEDDDDDDAADDSDDDGGVARPVAGADSDDEEKGTNMGGKRQSTAQSQGFRGGRGGARGGSGSGGRGGGRGRGGRGRGSK